MGLICTVKRDRCYDDITVQIVALETLSRLPPASLAIHSDAIAACLSLEEEEVQWAALEALSKLLLISP